MAIRYGNDYVVGIQADSAFDVDPVDLTTGWIYLPDKFEITGEAPQIIETGAKDQWIVPYNHTQYAGLKKPMVRISGVLTDTHEILLKALTNDTASAYTFTNVNTVNSYTIIQQFATAEANKVTGCVLETMTIRGEAGGMITYEATFRGGTVTRESTDTYTAQAVPDLKPFLFQNMAGISLVDATITNMNSFELTFTRSFPDDKFMFQNSQTWTAAYQCGITGQFKANYIYDSDDDSGVYSNLVSQTMLGNTFYFADDTVAAGYEKWLFVLYGQYVDYSLPDPDRCIFEGSFMCNLLYNGTNEPFTVTISTVEVVQT